MKKFFLILAKKKLDSWESNKIYKYHNQNLKTLYIIVLIKTKHNLQNNIYSYLDKNYYNSIKQ